MGVNQEFMDDLGLKYKRKKDGARSWAEEETGVRLALEGIEKDLDSRYKLVWPINIGGTAIVVEVTDTNLRIPRALKLPRPIKGKEILLKKIMEGEIARLVECSHPNIVSIYHRGEITVGGDSWPFYVMEFLPGALDGREWVERTPPRDKDLMWLLQQYVEGLVFLHARNVLHGDVKLENVLVMPDGHVKVSDLGSARVLDGDPQEETVLICDRRFAHPEVLGRLCDSSLADPARGHGTFKRCELRKVFDLYALGLNLLRLLTCYDPLDRKLLPQYERRYLMLMALRMLDGKVSGVEGKVFDLDGRVSRLNKDLVPPDRVFAEIKYRSAEEVGLDLKKLTGEYNLCHVVSELDHYYPRSIQSSQPHGASLTDRVASLLDSPYFRRLGGISQLGLIVQVYPTATHSRLEHVLGCYSNVARYIDALWQDAVNPFFRQVFSEHDINLVLVAALVHDIGQYPMAHDMEEADNRLFSHRALGTDILISTSNTDSLALRELLRKDWDVTPEAVVELLNANENVLTQPIGTRFLHTLIDGPLDADKLDYLIRDSINLNVPYGNCIDVERLLKCLTVVFKEEADGVFITLGIHEKGKIPAEAVAFARYAMFGAVYWQHTSRSAKAMLHRAIWEAIPDLHERRQYRQFKESFLWQVGRRGGPEASSAGQMPLVIDEATLKLKGETPQLASSDHDMLCWLHEKTTPQGKRLVKMLCRRKLFKRLMVLSRRGNLALWELLVEEFKKQAASGENMLKFQRVFQDKIVRLIGEVDDRQRVSAALQKDLTDRILRRNSHREVLFLVDIPGDRPGSRTKLFFIPEHRIGGPLPATVQPNVMEDSVVWSSLANQFVESVGKIRVFCAPDIAATCTACLGRDTIEGALASAARQVLSEQTGQSPHPVKARRAKAVSGRRLLP